MILYFGLGTRIKNIPWAVISIIAICVFMHTQFPHSGESMIKQVEVLKKEALSSSEGIALFNEYVKVVKKQDSNLTEAEIALRSYFEKVDTKDEDGNKKFQIQVTKKTKSSINIATVKIFIYDLYMDEYELKNLENYKLLKPKLEQMNENLKDLFIENDYLTHNRFSFIAYLKTVFSHGDFGHLFGNMIFLLIFGIYVEQRVGGVQFLISYFGMGLVSSYLYTLMSPLQSHNVHYLIGASGNVSVIMGMFLIAFWNHKMRMWVGAFPLPSMGKSFYLSVKVFFIPIFVMGDLIMSFGGSTGVAHLAHLLGFIFGCLYMYIWNQKHDLPKEFMYLFEYEKWKEMSEKIPDDVYFKEAMKLLSYNPRNDIVRDKSLKVALRHYASGKKISSVEKKLIFKYLPFYISSALKSENGHLDLLKRLSRVHAKSFGRLLMKNSQKDILKLIDLSLDHEHYLLYLHFVHAYFLKYPRSKKLNNISKTTHSVVTSVNFFDWEKKIIIAISQSTRSLKFKASLKNIHLSSPIGVQHEQNI